MNESKILEYKKSLLLNIEDYYVRKVKINNFVICEIPNGDIELMVKNSDVNIYLQTKYRDFLYLANKKTFVIESEGKIRNMWFCKIISYDNLIKEIDIENIKDKSSYLYEAIDMEEVSIIYGRCLDSMIFLDKIYRKYIYKHKFKSNEIIAIKSVAGSGKTTTLLELSKIHNNKKILYIAFNKSLILEIKGKIKNLGLKNLYPVTFDALMRDIFINKTNVGSPEITELKPQTIGFIINWFQNKPFRIKKYYIQHFNKFCNQTDYDDIMTFSKKILGGEKKLLTEMWAKTLKYELISFDTIRKMVEINHWCKDYIDNKYDLIFIDESQDFDNTMLKILLEDTTIPKLFVGDPKQAIYEWKGCINAFDKLPKESLIFEFYSTFRIGNPACEIIRNKFNDCNMISRSTNITHLYYDIVPSENYTYLFRNWRNLLQSAQHIKNIWINNYSSQIEYIKRLHERLKRSGLNEDELSEFADDLPKFLLKLSLEELEDLINNIEKNIVEKNNCNVEMTTIHSYKGLENDIIRIYNDIDIEKEQNLYYVALTRGKKQIILDRKIPTYENLNRDNRKQSFFTMNLLEDL